MSSCPCMVDKKIHEDNAVCWVTHGIFSLPSCMAGLVPQGTFGTGLSIKPTPEECKGVIFSYFGLSAFLWAVWMGPGNAFCVPSSLLPSCSGCGQHFPQCPWSQPMVTLVTLLSPYSPPRAHPWVTAVGSSWVSACRNSL